MDPHYFTREEVAHLLRVSMNTLLRMEARGEILTVRFGRRCVRIPAHAVLRITGHVTCCHPRTLPASAGTPDGLPGG